MAVAQQPTTHQSGSPNLGSSHDAMFRRVAIVLSSLPAHVSNRLMSSLSSETRNSLRHEINNLTDIDPLERRRAYQAFKGSLIQKQSEASEHVTDYGDTFVSATSRSRGDTTGTSRVYRTDDTVDQPYGQDHHGSSRPNHAPSTATRNRSRREMDFLADIEDDVLARVIADEHPQAIALVLASIAPVQAARIVATLEPRLQSDALNRIARLDEASSEAMADFSEHLRSKVDRFVSRSFSRSGSNEGRSALQAILDAMPLKSTTPPQTYERASMPAEHAVTSQRATMVDEVLSPRRSTENATATDDPTSSHSATDDNSAHDVASDPQISNPPTPQLAAVRVNPFESTDAIHQHLVQLKPQELCRALAEVETRQALLVLCGLPNNVVDNVLAALPRSQAKQVRSKLGSLGNLQLREIDEAKEVLALVSIGWKPGRANPSELPLSDTHASSSAVPIAA